MKYRAVRADNGTWRVQWRMGYVLRGFEPDISRPPVRGPHGPIWPCLTFPSQGEAESYIFKMIEEEALAKRNRKQKGEWHPQAYY